MEVPGESQRVSRRSTAAITQPANQPSHPSRTSHHRPPIRTHTNAHACSAATPTFAAIIALLTSLRLANGQPPLGFLNSWLYSRGIDGLNDITTGSSSGCFNETLGSGLPAPEIPGARFNATEGWDPVTGEFSSESNLTCGGADTIGWTGLGTPDFGRLREVLLGGGSEGYAVARAPLRLGRVSVRYYVLEVRREQAAEAWRRSVVKQG